MMRSATCGSAPGARRMASRASAMAKPERCNANSSSCSRCGSAPGANCGPWPASCSCWRLRSSAKRA
eukprot:11194433-Lingulodinium_polyedra.AAC.1